MNYNEILIMKESDIALAAQMGYIVYPAQGKAVRCNRTFFEKIKDWFLTPFVIEVEE